MSCTPWLTPGWVEAFNRDEIDKYGGLIVSGVKYYTLAGLFEYNLGDSEVLMLVLLLTAVPFAFRQRRTAAA